VHTKDIKTKFYRNTRKKLRKKSSDLKDK